MIKESLKQISFLTLITLFFFVCGSLYLLGFWSTFDLDISNLVEIGEIPQSFILPFAVSNSFAVLFFISQIIVSHTKKDELVGKIKDDWPSKGTIIILDMILNFSIGITFAVIISLLSKYNLNPTYWTVSGGILSVLVAFKLMGLPSTKEILPDETIRLYILIILVSTIVMSYALGKAKAVKIYTNKEIKYITAKTDNTSIEIQPISDTIRLKLLGFLGSKVIVSSLDNKKIHILHQSSVDVLTIEKVEEKLPENQKK